MRSLTGNRNQLVSLGILIALALTTSCEKQAHENTVAQQQYTIGAILPLTGALAFLGEPERNALLLAEKDAKEKGYRVALRIEDSRGSATDGVAAANRLLAGRAHALIVSTTGVSRAVLPVATQAATVVFTQCMDPTITSEGPHVFRLFPDYRQEQALTVEYLKSKSYSRIALLWANSSGVKPEAEALKDYAKQSGLSIVAEETFELSATDFRNQLRKLHGAKPDVLVALGYGQTYPPLLKQIRELDLDIPVVGNVALEQEGAVGEGVDVLEGVVFPSLSVGQQSAQIQKFRERYASIYGKYPGGFLDYPYFYDVYMILAEVLARGGGDSEKTRAYLAAHTFQGISGEIQFSSSGDAFPKLGLGVYRDGRVQPVE